MKQTPRLRFKEFSGDWKIMKLDELSKISSGGTPNRSNPKYWKGTIPWITTSLINFEDITFCEEHITEEGLNNSSAKIFPEGTILMAMYGQGKTRGKVAILNFEASTNQACAAIMSNEFIYNKFLFQTLYKSYKSIRNLSNEGGQKNLSSGLLKEFEISVPELPEQQKIAKYLTTVDKKISQLQEKKSLLKQYKKGIMQKIFGQEIRFKDDNGNSYPDWEEKKLGQIGDVINGLTYSPKDISEDGILVLRSSNVQNRVLTFDDNVYVNVGEGNYNPVKENDILICVRNGSKRLIGKNVIIDKVNEGVAFGAFMAIYRSDYNSFLFHLFDTDCYNKQVYVNLGATINSINGSDLKKFKVPFPSIEEQAKIANFLFAIDTKIQLVTTQLEKTQQFKKGLLQQMFV